MNHDTPLPSDKLTLRMLRYFFVLSQVRHFGRAAQQLNITPSPLSNQIKELEALLGVTLFHRDSRNVELTEAGQALQSECGHLFQVMDHGLNRVRRAGQAQGTALKMGLVSSAFWSGLGSRLTRFQQRHPDMQLDLKELPPQAQKRWLQEGRIDMGLVRFADAMNIHPLSATALTEEAFVVAMAEGHPLAGRARLSLEDLRDCEISMLSRMNSASGDLFLAQCRKQGVLPRIGKEFVEPGTLMAFIGYSGHVTIVPSSFTNHRWEQVRFVPLKERIEAGLYAIYDPGTLTAAGEAFIASWRKR
ncbi:LysR substrate-binding domain-containing protein [Ferrimonas gelatinilytica]|uniref:LysR family transcriptional regulator n=1 Tax=Ferrimonas gelatinilytica TaxID=1255257 RepID=A0ABP9RVK9_9GAMM